MEHKAIQQFKVFHISMPKYELCWRQGTESSDRQLKPESKFYVSSAWI